MQNETFMFRVDTKDNENVIPRFNRGIQEDIDCPIKSGNDKREYFQMRNILFFLRYAVCFISCTLILASCNTTQKQVKAEEQALTLYSPEENAAGQKETADKDILAKGNNTGTPSVSDFPEAEESPDFTPVKDD